MNYQDDTMKKHIVILFLASSFVNIGYSFKYVCTAEFRPLSYEELYMSAMAKAAYEREMKELYELNRQKAYECYSLGDWNGFLTYSKYALDCGWYNAKLYYDRGVVYEKLCDFKHAKKEYKKAKKKGYAYAEGALQSLKITERKYKHRQKQNRR